MIANFDRAPPEASVISLQQDMACGSRLLDNWSFTQIGGGQGTRDGEWIPVSSFPTTVHIELLKINRIPEPVSSRWYLPLLIGGFIQINPVHWPTRLGRAMYNHPRLKYVPQLNSSFKGLGRATGPSSLHSKSPMQNWHARTWTWWSMALIPTPSQNSCVTPHPCRVGLNQLFFPSHSQNGQKILE